MTRRGFLSSLAISTAALYLRFAPTSAQAAKIDRALPKPVTQEARTDDSVYQTNGHDCFLYKGQKLTALQLLDQLPRYKHRAMIIDGSVYESPRQTE